jgi:hypothetical protein
MIRNGRTALVLGLALAASAALAQPNTNAGHGPDETANRHVTVEERGTLPAVGGAGSTGPGGKLDCTKEPKHCSDPVNNAGSGSSPPGMPVQSK